MTAPARGTARPVRYRYHFTDFRLGRLLATLPMTGVKLEEVLGGPAPASGTVPLSPAVMRREPLQATIPRRSCLWAERQELDPTTGQVADSRIMWSGIVMGRSRSQSGRSMKISAVSWEAYLQRRVLVYDYRYVQADKFTIMRELVDYAITQPIVDTPDPGFYQNSPHHSPLYAGIYAEPKPLSGVLADRTYLATDLKPILESCRELAASGAGFDWKMTGYMETPGDLDTLKVRLDLGYPRLGRTAPPDLRWSTDPADVRQRWGYVDDLTITEDGSGVHNRVHALGEGTGPNQLRAVADSIQTSRNEMYSGYPLYETSLGSATTDLRTQDSVTGHALGALTAQLASETQVSGVKVRGDLHPVVTSYGVGDDATLRIGATLTGEPTTIIGQITGRAIEPPEQGSTERVTFDLQGAA